MILSMTICTSQLCVTGATSIKIFRSLAVTGLLGIMAITGVRAADPLPNIVLIISDDQAWGDYAFMGHEQIETPRLDRLASESLVFPRGYVPSSLCCPSLATMITGLSPRQHGITGNDPSPPKPMSFAARQRDPAYQRLCIKMDDPIAIFPTLPTRLAH